MPGSLTPHPRGAGRPARRHRLLLRARLDRRPAGRPAGGRSGRRHAGGDGRPAETVIATHPATGLELTLHAAAVNAVMAGCLPEYFPVLVAAFEAMDKPDFNFHGSTASTGGSAPLLIVERPLCRRHRHECRREPVRPRQPGQRHHRPGGAADPAQRLPDDPRHLRQVDPRQSGQVQLLHRRARARQSVAAAVRGAGLSRRASRASPPSPAAASATSRTTAATRRSRSSARSPTPWPTTAASRSARAW